MYRSYLTGKGFTLIELIIVIVLLSILAITAAPKFLNLNTDARIAVIRSLEASFKTAAEQAYTVAIINGVEKLERSGNSDSEPAATINGHKLELKSGYPESWAEAEGSYDILDLIDISHDLDICYSSTCNNSTNSSRVKVGFDTTEDTGCYVKYIEPRGTGGVSTTYTLLRVTEGC